MKKRRTLLGTNLERVDKINRVMAKIGDIYQLSLNGKPICQTTTIPEKMRVITHHLFIPKNAILYRFEFSMKSPSVPLEIFRWYADKVYKLRISTSIDDLDYQKLNDYFISSIEEDSIEKAKFFNHDIEENEAYIRFLEERKI